MPTDVIKTIGPGGDYTDLATWIGDCPADLVSADQRYIGEVKNTELTAGVTIAGITTDATRYIILRAASGASFRDQAGVRTTALNYDAANGAAVKVTTAYSNTILVSVPYTQVKNLQLWGIGASTNCIAFVSGSWTGGLVDSCIIVGTLRVATGPVFVNCLIEGTSSPTNGADFHYCTLVSSGSTNIANGVYGQCLCKNTALFDNGGTAFSGAGFSGSNNATDAASAPGTSNQTGLTYSTQFVNSASDWRAVDTGSLKNGTPDATFATTDITGATRDVTTPYIGCWEVVAVIPSGTARSLFRPANLTLGSGGSYFSNPLT